MSTQARKAGYPVVDLFAGAGGLGEGFAGCRPSNQGPAFRSVLSVESEPHPYQTLLLRHFFRQFNHENVPESYYNYLASKISRKELIAKNEKQWRAAENAVLQIRLGEETRGNVKNKIRQRLGDSEKWALIGGPPCQVYSVVGRARRKNDPGFKDDEKHFLYQEYLKIIIDHEPPVFVMENVKGLLSARINGQSMMDKIFNDLSNPRTALPPLRYKLYSISSPGKIKQGDDPKCFVVRAEKYGVPQARHRVFILGIRSDLKVKPVILQGKGPPTIKEVIGNMPKVRSGVSREKDTADLWRKIVTSADSNAWLPGNHEDSKKVKNSIKSAVDKIKNADLQTSSVQYEAPRAMSDWYHDERLGILTCHEARGHMASDLHRYLFVSSYGEALERSPRLADFPKGLLPGHKNADAGREGKSFSDRFRVQLAEEVSTTVTSHIAKDGHYFIHHDPAQCRSLTVREAARLQTFPDNYFFEGPRTSQYTQVGNAVPPYLAKQVADIVKNVLDRIPDK